MNHPPPYNPNSEGATYYTPAVDATTSQGYALPVYPTTHDVNHHPPQRQTMTTESFLDDCDAIFVRQKLQVCENICTCLEMQNKYHVFKTNTEDANRYPPLTDREYWLLEQRAFILEESNFCCRFLCQRHRACRFGMYRDEASSERSKTLQYQQKLDTRPVDYMSVYRPFRCTLWYPLCPCCVLWPQTAVTMSHTGSTIGGIKCDWSCGRCTECCWNGRLYLRVLDNEGTTRYFLRPLFPTLCNGCKNCCAPTCCNKVWRADIVDSSGVRVVGNYKDNYPGSIGCRCVSNASNFSMTFPADATSLDKANLLGALMLAEMMIHEKKPGQDN